MAVVVVWCLQDVHGAGALIEVLSVCVRVVVQGHSAEDGVRHRQDDQAQQRERVWREAQEREDRRARGQVQSGARDGAAAGGEKCGARAAG